MKYKKCYLKLYLNNNLGDDLFAKIISEKYPNTKFVIASYVNQKSNLKNIKVITGFWFRATNKILKILTNKKVTIENMLAKKYKRTLVLGGSLFIEGKSGDYKELKKSEEYYIIGTNFGPYKTDKYMEYCKKIFENASYVCFRDKTSYELFKNLKNKNITYAPDIVYGLDTKNINITNNKKALISIIDCKRKLDESYQEKYEEKIIDLIYYFQARNYEVVLMSFCKKENDEVEIERILDKLNLKAREKISKYYYDGDIKEALNVIGDCRVVIGSRFHANILGLILDKTIIPVIYSDKTINALKDINFKGKIIDIRKLDEFKVEDLKEEDLTYKVDVSKEKELSKKHFELLDKIFK